MNMLSKVAQLRLDTLAFLRSTLCSYGELVLRPVTIAERVAGTEIAFSPSNNKK